MAQTDVSLDRANSTPHALTIRNLVKMYGSLAAVDGVSLDIPRGSFLTLLGPSGSGKTTILMAIAGFVTPTSGQVLLDGQDITGLAPEKRNFGMVFQGYALFPHMTVEQNVWFPLRVRGIGRQQAESRIREALESVQLGHLRNRLPSELSGGQQQRVALARAISFQPDLLLLDEPLSALDKKLRADLQWELKELHQKLGTTFVYVTHDQEEALSMSDQVIILRDGAIEQSGDPIELYERPATSFVADFLGKSNFIRGRAELAGDSGFRYRVGDQLFRQAGAPRPATADGEILVALRPEKIQIADSNDGMVNSCRAVIDQFNYHGANYHLKVSTPGLGDLFVTAPAWRCEIEPAVGNRIWIGWEPDAAVLVRETTTPAED